MSAGYVDPEQLCDLARQVAADAADYVNQRRGSADDVGTKSSSSDLVTEVDRAAERIISTALTTARPGDGILGEEGSGVQTTTGVRWIIDPIDGTTSFVYGMAGFAISIAAEVTGTAVAGVVNAPMIGSEYYGWQNGGAYLNGSKVSSNHCTELSEALIGTGFAFDAATRARQGAVLVELLPRVRDIRRIGSAALDLASVAAGQLDAYYEFGINLWDFAAGALIAKQAGCNLDIEYCAASGKYYVAAAPPSLAAKLFPRLRKLGAHLG